jgi:hypothetical protein
MATIKLQNDKVILKDGKVSCSCCGYCKYFDIENLLNIFGSRGQAGFGGSAILAGIDVGEGYQLEGQDFGVIGFENQPDPPVVGDFKVIPKDACLRFLCREVIVDGGIITSETNTYIGGPTTTGKDLWEDICFPLFGDESQSGTYLYIVKFFGWYSDWGFNPEGYSVYPRYWQSSDENGEVWKLKITREEIT